MEEANNSKHTRTMQVSVNISDEEYKLLTEIAEVTGRSNSALAGEWIKRGIYEEIQNLSKVDEWRRKRLPQEKPKTKN
jgi:predicted transcriptional regulator